MTKTGGKGSVLTLFAHDIMQSYRSMKERMIEHPVMTAWFIILLLAGFGTTLFMIEYASQIENPLLEPSRGDILFSLFFLIFAKASAETVESTLRNKGLKHLFYSPIDVRKVLFCRIMRVFWYNLLLVAISMSIVSFLVPLFSLNLPLDLYFLPHLYMMLLSAPVLGFTMGVISQIKSIPKKIISLFIYGQSISILWWATHTALSPEMLFLLPALITLVSFSALLIYPKLFIESWKHGVTSSSSSSFRFHEAGDFLPKILPDGVRVVAEKEILDRWRRRQSPTTIAIIASIGAGLYFFYYQLGASPELGLGLGKFLYPTLIGMALYLAVVLQIVFPSLTLFGREGRNLWSLKTVPVTSRDVASGKILGILIYSPLILLAIAVPLPLILGYPIEFLLFAVTAGLAMIFAFSGIGIWSAARFPNFDESSSGAPDIITMYTVLIICLVMALLLIGYPLVVLQMDHVLGVLIMIFSADIAALILIILIGRAGKLYEKMELDI